ncbi:hypothetical protein QN277_018742 [Acacia crassicarpa]|uniref:Uncharacterized protein n=1 Tax=Acacia crassicarpa TaxID=499986 RepID=A0AAE1KI53_9FABA|nr:hypothetical protein QN277_018742 [Acacia crassicarpa]
MTSFSGRMAAVAGGAASSSGHARLPQQPIRTAGGCEAHFSYAVQRSGIVLRSSRRRSRIWIVEASGPAGAWEKSDDVRDREKVRPCVYAIGDVAAEGGSDGGGIVAVGNDRRRMNRTAEVVFAAAMTVVMGVGNRVLYKLALVPLKNYPFFLAQLATVGYLVVYFSILLFRYRAGIVTDEMLSTPKAPFIAVGLLEALGAAVGMAAGTILAGASIPILSQSFLVWQIILSSIFLGRRYRVNQLLGCFLVAVGVITSVASAGNSLMEGGIFWSALMILSFLFQAADTVLKEIIFRDAAQKLKGGSLDLFVVSSFGSVFQTLFLCLLLPFLSKLWGVPFNQLPNYLKDSAACFLNVGTLTKGCDGAPLLPLLYVIANIGFNISLLHLLKISSAVVSCLAATLCVPISIYIFTLPLPYLGVASSLPTGFIAGAVILLIGLLVYSWVPPNASSSPTKSAST